MASTQVISRDNYTQTRQQVQWELKQRGINNPVIITKQRMQYYANGKAVPLHIAIGAIVTGLGEKR